MQRPAARACRVTAKVLRGSFGAVQEQSIQVKKTRPRQEELAGKDNQGISRNLPRRATRPGKATRPRQEELAGKTNQGISRPSERQASGPDKATAAARRLPRQVATLCPRSSASTNVSLWGPFQARVAEGCAACGARWHAELTRSPSWRAVASLTVHFALFRRHRRAFNALVPCRQGKV